MPEVGGQFCRYVDPHDVDDGFEVVRDVLSDRAGLGAWTNDITERFRTRSWRAFASEFFAAAVATAKVVDTENLEDRGVCCLLETALVSPLGAASLAEMEARGQKLVSARMSRISGWHQPELWGCWASSRHATMRFRTRLPAGSDCVVYLHLRMPYDLQLGDCAVKSGGFTTFLQIGGVSGWRVARSRVGAKGIVDLALLSGKGFKDRDLEIGNDPRQLYVGVIAIAIAPMSDPEARRQIVEQIVPQLSDLPR
jgi:hypothetical protein